MKLADLLAYSLEGLAERKLRTALTLAGIVIGVGALASLQSLAEGARANVLGRWEGLGLMSQFAVTPRGETTPWGSRRRPRERRGSAAEPAGAIPSPEAPPRPLDEAALAEIRKIPGVRLVSVPQLRIVTLASRPQTAKDGAGKNVDSEKRTETLLYGLPPELPRGEGIYKLEAGYHLEPGETTALLLGKRLSGELGFDPPEGALGRTIEASWEELVPSPGAGPAGVSIEKRTRELKVAGIIDAGTAYMTVGPFRAVVSQEAAARINPASLDVLRALAGKDSVHAVTVFLQRGTDLDKTEERVREMGFSTISALEYLSEIRRGMLFMQALLGCLGGVALSVAALGIANTFLTAVYERTHEIGVRRAVGARRGDIRRHFLCEAGVLGLAGGVAGLALAWGADRYLATAAFRWVAEGEKLPDSFYVFTPRLVTGSLAFSVLISVAASLYPAARAARLSPVDSLSHE